MNDKLNTVMSMNVIMLTKHLMKKLGCSEEEAFIKLSETSLYQLMLNKDTELCFETDNCLMEFLDKEMDYGNEVFWDYIEPFLSCY